MEQNLFKQRSGNVLNNLHLENIFQMIIFYIFDLRDGKLLMTPWIWVKYN